MDYQEFFHEITDFEPYPYQVELGNGDWPDMLDIPTGLGKTAAVVIAWLWRHLKQPSLAAYTPRRLVYCLPMRVLVEQTSNNIHGWLERAEPFFHKKGLEIPRTYLLMGGEIEDEWELHPEKAAILVGTQDMLLSRALNRAYAMSRYKWPVHFALLHNDAFWVFDEIQLMGPGLCTSAQIEAFRRAHFQALPSRSLWVSATLNRKWLSTVDLRPHVGTLSMVRLSKKDLAVTTAAKRVKAKKKLKCFDGKPVGKKEEEKKAYLDNLSQAVIDCHHENGASTNTLIIVNTVERAQKLFEHTKKKAEKEMPEVPVILVHSRFRTADRNRINREITEEPPSPGRVIIATQAVEAGIDISSRTLFTELAPWSSMVQRFGRCNRYGEFNESGADIYWIDMPSELSAPYEEGPMTKAREKLGAISSGSPTDLPATDDEELLYNILRQKDFLELFNTDPDLSGFDIDVSQYIRDAGSSDVQVFWRDFEAGIDEQVRPNREELCRASMKQVDEYAKKRKSKSRDLIYTWDVVEKRWRLAGNELRPGMTIMLDSRQGGYDAEQGFLPRSKERVVEITVDDEGERPEANDDDQYSKSGISIEIARHLSDVADEARQLCTALQEEKNDQVIVAGRWHDVGKTHEVFQNTLHSCDEAANGLLAKSPCRGKHERPGFRHELASMLAWLERGELDDQGSHDRLDGDLIAYLIAAHHGKVRMSLRAWPNEREPEDPGRRYARGVWQDDELPAIDLDGKQKIGPVTLDLALMEMGRGEMGRSWRERTETLLAEYGPFYLAWLETLVRIADWRASRAEEESNG